MNKYNVLIVDDEQNVSKLLQKVLLKEGFNAFCAVSGEEAIPIIDRQQVDVMITDLKMPGMNGLQAARRLKESFPDVKIVVITRHNERGYVQECLRAGAAGYVLKQSSSDELLRALRAVANGNRYLDPAITSAITDSFSDGRMQSEKRLASEITDRETEVLRLIASGFSNKEIGSHLNISVKTVETHKANSMKKLDLTSRIDIVRFALLQGWLKND